MHLFGILRSHLLFIDGSGAEAIIVQSQAIAIAKCHANGQVKYAAFLMLQPLICNATVADLSLNYVAYRCN